MLSDFLNLELLNISLSYPFLFLIAVAVALLLFTSFYRLHRSFYTSVSALSLCVSFLLMLTNVGEQGFEAKAFLGTLNTDLISFYASCVILLFAFLYLLVEKEENQGEFYVLFLLMIASFLLMVSSSNLVLIFIGLESSSLSLYTLIAMRGTMNSISAAIKYFSVAAVGSGFFVLACALIYARSGSLDLAVTLSQDGTKDIWLLGAGVLIFVLCAIKLSLAPFHFWLRDVYFASHSNLVAFISVVPKVAMFAILIRIFDFLKNTSFESIIMSLAIFSMIIGAVGALSQKNIKKMFAYSSIVHSSFIVTALVPILTPFDAQTDSNLVSIFGYWVLFGFANYAVFLILSRLENSDYTALSGLLYKKPFIAFSLGICVLSLAGIPPFGVFWGKFMIMITTITSGYWYLAIFIAIASVIILYAYLKIIVYALFIKDKLVLMQKLDLKQNLVLALSVLVAIFAVVFML